MKILKIGSDLDGVILLWLFFIKKNTREVLAKLKAEGHTIKIVTARGNFLTLFQAKLMLKIYGLGYLEVVGVGKNGQKYSELEGFDIFIDNKVSHLLAIDGRVKNLYIFSKKSKNDFCNLETWWKVYWEVEWIAQEEEQ